MLERKGIINSNEMAELKKSLYDNLKDFYNNLRAKGKVDAKGNIIKNKLSCKEKQEHDALIACKKNIRKKYFSTKNKVLFLCESIKDKNSKDENNLPYYGESNLRKKLISLKKDLNIILKKLLN